MGGFLPFGIAGVMAGAAKCFFGFTGFDCVCTTGEEAKNPQRNIPLAIIMSLIIIFFAYFGISTVLTMMAPYYLLDVEAPFPKLYDSFGWTEIKWVVSVGTIFALCTSLLGAMFPLPRILYAMGKDGIIYRFLSTVSKRTMTPLIATLIAGLLASIMALLFAIHQLIEMMSIGTLLAYTIVAISVLVLRYQPPEDQLTQSHNFYSVKMNKMFLRQILNLNGIKEPNEITSQISKLAVIGFAIICTMLCVLMRFMDTDFYTKPLQIGTLVVFLAGMFLCYVAICRQPMMNLPLYFKVPLVPFFPLFSIFINTYLMCQLEYQTWIRFAIWLAIGYFIYFTYGLKQSDEAKKTDEIKEPIRSQGQEQSPPIRESYTQHSFT